MRTTPKREGQAPTSSAAASTDTKINRRRFLFAMSAGAAGSAAAAASAIAAPVMPDAPAAAPETNKGYRESEHVRDYYRSARI